jgi:hypothetical protein
VRQQGTKVPFTGQNVRDILGVPPESKLSQFVWVSLIVGRVGMKSKMQHHVQPRESVQRNEQASEEIQTFLRAVDSYPERVAKDPGISFRRHLSSLFAASPNATPRRH